MIQPILSGLLDRPSTFVCVLALLTVQHAAAATRYVDVDSATPSPPYTSWATAAREIQVAVDVSFTGDTILVAEGTYSLASQVMLTNGVSLSSVEGATNTIVDAGGSSRCLFLSHPNAVVEGFTLTRGDDASGGGALCEQGLVRDCVIVSNSATWGGGISLCGGGVVENCTIRENRARDDGGGVQVESGGILRGCRIAVNEASEFGGGIRCNGGTLERCRITDNTAARGGGAYVEPGSLLRSCLVAGNSNTGAGAAGLEHSLHHGDGGAAGPPPPPPPRPAPRGRPPPAPFS